MSIQFRSRIKPAIDYTQELNSFGTCCTQTDGVRSAVSSSFYECFASGGQFVAEPWDGTSNGQCPQTDTRLGCCCACSYVSDDEYDLMDPRETPYLLSGLESNVSKCECDRFKGKWTEGVCPALTEENLGEYCVLSNMDVRYPRACSHMGVDDITGWPTSATCSDVCTYSSCTALGTTDHPAVYDQNARCTIPLGLNLNNNEVTYGSTQTFSTIVTKLINSVGGKFGSCYDLENVNGTLEYNCSISEKRTCLGYWVEEQNANNIFCVTSYQPTNPTKIDGKYQPQTMSQASFDAIGLTLGDEFQGGIYLGIFEPSPNNPRSSLVLGNIDFGKSTETRFNGDSVGNASHKKWALIADKSHYAASFLQMDEPDVSYKTSMWDGYYNTYGQSTIFPGIRTKLTDGIRDINIGGFIDWYIPSIHELGFYSLYVNNTEQNIDSGILLSSSTFSSNKLDSTTNKVRILNNHSFVYGQQCRRIDTTDTYRVGLVDKNTMEFLRLFRRIVIE